MKKRLVCLLFVLLMIFSGCINNDETDTNEGSFCLLINEPVTLFENDDITINIKSSNKLSDTEFRLHFEAVNKTDEIYSLFLHPIRINNTSVLIFINSYDIPPQSVYDPHEFYIDLDYKSEEDLKDTTEVHTLSFLYFLTREDEENKNVNTDIVCISKGGLYKNISLPDKYLIGSDEYFDVYFVSIKRMENKTSLPHSLLLYNKSDKVLRYDLKSLAINNISVNTYSHFLVEPESYYYYISPTYTPSLWDTNSNKDVACVEIDFRCYENDKAAVLSSMQSKLILNDDIELAEPEIQGNIIYNQNDIIISVKTEYLTLVAKDYYPISLYWNVYNNSDKSYYLKIENIITSQGYGDHFENYKMHFSVLPNTSSDINSYGYKNLISNGVEYTITADLIFLDENWNEINRETLTFTVK